MAMVSATGANLRTLLQVSRRRPDLVEVVLVASDRPAGPALDVAREAGVPTWPGSAAAECGRWSDCVVEEDRAAYRRRAIDYHDRLCVRVERFEARSGEVDLVVLAYHRWVHGALLDKFAGRMVNQHPGDLTALDAAGHRTLAGLDPVGTALRRGDRATRTCSFVVDDTHDGGAVIVRGPALVYLGPRPPGADDVVAHELEQKRHSDRPALTWALTALAEGRIRLDPVRRHVDGSAVVLLDGRPTPLGGHELCADAQPAPA